MHYRRDHDRFDAQSASYGPRLGEIRGQTEMPEDSFHRADLFDERKEPQTTATARTLEYIEPKHEGACRLLAEGVDIRIIQLMLGHASIQQTQRYLNVTDEELRKGLEVSWINQSRPIRLASQV